MDGPKFKPYDCVWVMLNGEPSRMVIFSAVQCMDYSKSKIEIFYGLIKKSNPIITIYNLVKSQCGAGWHADYGIRFSGNDIFLTKEDLLEAEISRLKSNLGDHNV